MKIALVTANIGNFDPVLGMPVQVLEEGDTVDLHYFNETNLPFPLSNLDNRTKARYLKSQTHRFLPEYDAYIWVDGRIHIEGNNFVKSFIEQLEGYDLAAYKHFERNNVYDEMDYILTGMTKGSASLLKRYGNQQLVKEILFYTQRGLPKNYPLLQGGFYARRNNPHTNKCFDEWWKRILEFSNSDQTMLSLAIWESGIKANLIENDPLRTHKLFTIGKHN